MLGALLALGLTSAAAPADRPEPATELRSRRRVPLPFLLLSLGSGERRIRRSAIIEAVSDLFEAHTDFAIALVDSDRVAGCRGRLSCLVTHVRPDYRQPSDARSEVPGPFLILSQIASGTRTRLLPQWIDTEAALDVLRADPQARDPKELEAEMGTRAQPVRLRGTTIRSPEEAQRWLEKLVRGDLRPYLEDTQHWEPLGELTIEDAPEGAAVIVDGETLGTSRAGTVIVRELRPGTHQVELQRGTAVAWSRSFTLGIRDRARIQVGTKAEAGPGPSALFWTGLGLTAAGLATTAVALTLSPSGSTVYCNSDCGNRFVGLDESLDATGLGGAPSGVLAGPLGLGLVVAGATWSVGSLLEADAEVPWISILTGVALGGLVYGVSAATNSGPSGALP